MDNKTLDDEELGVIVDQKTKDSTGWYDSKLSKEREEVTKYYNGELPKRTSNGSSSFVSTDVYDAVESMKAQLLETFAAGHKIVKFDPLGPEDVIDCRVGTAYTDHVVFTQNDGYGIFRDTIDDGLRARVGVAHVWWEECEHSVDFEFDKISQEEALALANQPDVAEFDAAEDPEGSGVFSGKMTRKVDKSQIRIEVVNPEEFFIENNAKCLDSETFCGKRSMKSIDELAQAGYDRAKLRKWNSDDDTYLNSSPEVLARFQQINSGFNSKGDEEDDMRQVLVTEAYIKCMREGDKYAKLYKVVRVGSETLETEEVEDHPFVTFVPLPVPHSFYGNNFAARVIPTQNARTVLTRSILDHTAITTNPRLQVLKGGIVNPKELLDNRLGGIVNTTRPDAITPIQQANLNPYVFTTLELIKSQNEETTGISSLSQGLNKDAISKQNSGAMVEKLVSLSQTRQKIIARNFANGFLIPLFLKVYNLVLAKEKRPRILEVAGEWNEVDVSKWKERRSASVTLRLGYGEIEREAAERAKLGVTIASDPALNRCFELKGRFKMAQDIAELTGIHNFLDYMTPPEKLEPPAPDPIQMKKIELEERKVAAMEMTAQAAQKKIEANVSVEAARQQLETAQRAFDNAMLEHENERKDIDIANKVDVSQRETAMLEATPITTNVGNVSPR